MSDLTKQNGQPTEESDDWQKIIAARAQGFAEEYNKLKQERFRNAVQVQPVTQQQQTQPQDLRSNKFYTASGMDAFRSDFGGYASGKRNSVFDQKWQQNIQNQRNYFQRYASHFSQDELSQFNEELDYYDRVLQQGAAKSSVPQQQGVQQSNSKAYSQSGSILSRALQHGRQIASDSGNSEQQGSIVSRIYDKTMQAEKAHWAAQKQAAQKAVEENEAWSGERIIAPQSSHAGEPRQNAADAVRLAREDGSSQPLATLATEQEEGYTTATPSALLYTPQMDSNGKIIGAANASEQDFTRYDTLSVVEHAGQIMSAQDSVMTEAKAQIDAAEQNIEAVCNVIDTFLQNAEWSLGENGEFIFANRSDQTHFNHLLMQYDAYLQDVNGAVSAHNYAVNAFNYARQAYLDYYGKVRSSEDVSKELDAAQKGEIKLRPEQIEHLRIEKQVALQKEQYERVRTAEAYMENGGTTASAVESYQAEEKVYRKTATEYFTAVAALNKYVDSFIQSVQNDERADVLRAARDKDLAEGIKLSDSITYTEYKNFFAAAVETGWMDAGFVPEELTKAQQLTPGYEAGKSKLESAANDMNAMWSYNLKLAYEDESFDERAKPDKTVAEKLDGDVKKAYKYIAKYFDNLNDVSGSFETSGAEIYFRELGFLSEEEKAVFFYFCNTGEQETAALFLASLDDDLTMRVGEAETDALDIPVIRETIVPLIYKAGSSLVADAYGLVSHFVDIDPPELTSTDYAMASLSERHKGTPSGYVMDAFMNIGNMLPTTAAYLINPNFGSAVTYLNARGDAYIDAKRNGYSYGQAYAYSTMVGLSEAFLERALGLLGGVGKGAIPEKLSNITAKINKWYLRLAADYAIDLGGEVLEENIQNYLEPAFKVMVFAEDKYNAPDFEDFAETTIVTVMTTAFFKVFAAPGDVKQYKIDDCAAAWATEALKADKGSDTYKAGETIRYLLDNGEHIDSDYLLSMIFKSAGDPSTQNRTEARLASEVTEQRAAQVQEANPDATVLTSNGTQAYLDTGVVTLKVAQDAGEVLDGIVAGDITSDSISNKKIDRLKTTQEFGRKAVSSVLGVEVKRASTASLQRAAVREAIRTFEQNNAQKNAEAQNAVATAQNQPQQSETALGMEFDAQNSIPVQTQQNTMSGTGAPAMQQTVPVTGGEAVGNAQAVPQDSAQNGKSSAGQVESNTETSDATGAVSNVHGDVNTAPMSYKEFKYRMKNDKEFRNRYAPSNKNLSEEERNTIAYDTYLTQEHAATDSDRADTVQHSVKDNQYGVERNEYSENLDQNVVSAIDALAKLFHLKVRFGDLGENNGLYHADTGLIELDISPYHKGASNGFLFSVSHEIGHAVKERIGAKAWAEFADYAVKAKNGAKAIKAKQESAAEYSDYAVAREEVVCDFIGELLSEQKTLDTFCESIKDGKIKTETARGIVAVWRKITGILRGKGVKQTDAATAALVQRVQEQFNTDIETAENAVRKMQKALSAAMKAEKNGNTNAVTKYSVKEYMTEQERYDELKDRYIEVPSDIRSKDYAEDIYSLEQIKTRAKSKAEAIIYPLAEKLGILNRSMNAPEVDIEFLFSKNGGLKESLSKQLRYGGNYADFAKALINIDRILECSVLVEKHTDKYAGTSRANEHLEMVYVLFGAFRDGDVIVPVQFEIKKASDAENRLYLTIAMTKVEASVLGSTLDKGRARFLIPASTNYRIADIFQNINPKDKHFLKYLPDAFLTDLQIEAKNAALQEDEKRIAQYSLNNYENRYSKKDKPRRIVPTPEEAKALDERLRARDEEKAAQKLKERDEMIKRLVYTSPGFAPYRSIKDNLTSMADQHGRIPQGESPARDVTVPVSTDGETKVRHTVRTAMEAEATPKEMIPHIEESIVEGNFNYKPKKNAKTMDAARAWVERRGDVKKAYEDWLSEKKRRLNADMIARGFIIYNNLSNACANATTETERTELREKAISILQDISVMGTVAGQTAQAIRLLKQQSPESQYYALERAVRKLQDGINERYGDKQNDAPKIEIDKKRAAKWIQALREGDMELAYDLEEVLFQQIAKQIPKTLSDRLNAWRYLSMLGNPKTLIRNAFGNAAFTPIVMAKDQIGALMEKLLPKEQRTKYFGSLHASEKGRALLKFASEDALSSDVQQMMERNKYDDTNVNDRLARAVSEHRRTFDAPVLKQWQAATRYMMEKMPGMGDEFYKGIHYRRAFAGAAMARGYTVADFTSGIVSETELIKLRTYATNQAMKATFNDANKLSDLVSRMHTKSKVANTAIEGTLPFKRTPANVAVRSFEYSPLSLLRSLTTDLYALKTGKITGQDYIEHLAQGVTGTILFGLGWLAAATGIVRVGADDDDEREGRQSYSLELFGESVTLDWLAPTSVAFFMGAEARELFFERDMGESFLDAAVDAGSNIFAPVLEMTALSGAKDLLDTFVYSYNKDGADAGQIVLALFVQPFLSYLGQFAPTAFGQFENMFEPYRTTTYVGDIHGKVDRTFVRNIAKILEKVPFVDWRQIEYVDDWGRKDYNGNVFLRFFNSFINPAYVNDIVVTDVDTEVRRIKQSTGTNVSPKRRGYSITVTDYDENGDEISSEKVTLSAEQFEAYQTEYGKQYAIMSASLMASTYYDTLSDKEKAKAFKEIESLADEYGKIAAGVGYVLDKSSTDNKLYELVEAGMPVAEAYAARLMYTQLSKDEDLTPVERYEKFRVWVYGNEEWTDAEKAAVIERFGRFSSGFVAKSENFDEMIQSGSIDADIANSINGGIREIEPEDGKDEASVYQKYDYILSRKDLSPSQKDAAIIAYMGDQEEARFNPCADSGVSATTYANVALRIHNLKPTGGRTNVNDGQKWEVCVNSVSSVKQQDALLNRYMDKEQSAKYKQARSAGVSPSLYVKYYNAKYTYGDGNGSWNQNELQHWLDENVSSRSQKATLWELTNSSWKNNPYK